MIFNVEFIIVKLMLLRSFNVKGKSAHDGPISGSVSISVNKNVHLSYINGIGKIEGKYTDKATGNALPPHILPPTTGA